MESSNAKWEVQSVQTFQTVETVETVHRHGFFFPATPFLCHVLLWIIRLQEASLVGTSKWQKLTLEGWEIMGSWQHGVFTTTRRQAKHSKTTDAVQQMQLESTRYLLEEKKLKS